MNRKWCAVAVTVAAAMALATWAQAAVSEEMIQKITAAMPAKAIAKPAKARKLLVFTLAKGFPHGSIPVAAKALEIMGKKTGAFEATESADPAVFKAETIAKFDAVCMDNTTGDLFGDDGKKALVDFVSGGKGMAGIHAATDCFYNWKDYGEMMGGYFSGHPFRRISVKLDDPGSPLTAAFREKGFQIEDEIYTFKDPYSREKLHVLLSIDWENSHLGGGTRSDNDYALSWIHEYGKGRVFYCAFGHDDAIFWNPAILKHYLAGLQYVLGDLKADATPSAKLEPPLKPARGPDLAKPEPKIMKAPLVYYAPASPDAAKPEAEKSTAPKADGEERPKSLLERDLDRLKAIYAYSEWAGKTKMEGLVAALKFDAQTFADLGAVQAIEGKENRFSILIRRDAKTLDLELRVEVSRMESALAVHEDIMHYFALCSRLPPVYKRPTEGELVQVGDVCFVPNFEWVPKGSDKPILGVVLFARNNVLIRVNQWGEGKQTYWDMAAIAKRIDKQVVEWLPKPRDKDQAKPKTETASPAPAGATGSSPARAPQTSPAPATPK